MSDPRSPRQAAVGPDLLESSARTLVRAAAACASFCEHVEHNEPTTTHAVTMAADEMRTVAARLASASGLSLLVAYRDRLRQVETTSLLQYIGEHRPSALAGVDVLERARTWDEVQVGQMVHDRQFHPDVFGLSKVDQLRHYTFHVTKLAGLLVDAIDTEAWDAFRIKRLADVAIFGVKLSTVCNERLPASPVDEPQERARVSTVAGRIRHQ